MIKKFAIILALALCALCAKAQLATGGWTLHTPFSGVSAMAETNDMVFIQSGTSLLSISKNTGEVRSLNISNDLNGSLVTGLYAHPEGKYVIVAYSDCNIDRINNDGSVINISDIADANVTGGPSIKDVGFGKDRFYVVTSFGLVTFNDKKNETVETLYTDTPLQMVTGLGDRVVLFYNDRPYVAKASDRLVSLDKFTLFQDAYVAPRGGKFPIGDSRLLITTRSNSNGAFVLTFDWENGKLQWHTVTDPSGSNLASTSLMPMDDGRCAVVNDSWMAVYDASCASTAPERIATPAVLKGSVKSALRGLGQLWAGFSDGACSYNLSDPANPVQTSDKMGRQNLTSLNLYFSQAQPNGEIYFWNVAMSRITGSGSAPLTRPSATQSNFASLRTGGKFTEFAPKKLQYINGAGQPATQTSFNDALWLIQDPKDPSAYFTSFNNGNYGGVYRFKDGEQTLYLSHRNSKIYGASFLFLASLGFDNFNNLIIVQEVGTQTSQVKVIPYDKLTDQETAASAMQTFTLPGGNDSDAFRSLRFLSLKKSNTLVVARSAWGTHLTFVHQGNSADPSQWKAVQVTKFIDQDNRTLSFYHIWALHEDSQGRLWVGTNMGVFEITDPSKINSETAVVRSIKVPRGDGTNLADYLCDAQTVTGITSDNTGRKWIATDGSGVYLVNENGSEIFDNFTADNSPLPSNNVFSITCDPGSSSVFFVCQEGIAEYKSDSAPASDNLNEVYAFPNPVRPDYTGWITITGLMDNTLVKIADAAGNVFYQGRSEGGTITWDGCNAAGDRVKTGIYYVMASSGTSGQNGDSCVTKIMVVN